MKYGDWNLHELRKELKTRGARVSGRKIDLVERLESYDRNSNFGREPVLEPEYEMELPSLDTYRDVNGDTALPSVVYGAVIHYLQPFNKKIGNSAKDLYNSKFLKYVRFSHQNGLFYVKSECAAEMKRHVTYRVDVCIDNDGSVVECQCECAAGQGPTAHCKHVCALLFGMYTFSTTGEFATESTCTQKLQTFHQSKRFKGSPIKAEHFDLSSSQLNVSFEPRPNKFIQMKGYFDCFRNVWLNQKEVNSLPVSHMFGPANPYAINVDHDYLKLTPADTFLKQQSISEVSYEERRDIELITRGQANNPLWKLEHNKRITSSNFGKICLATDRTNFCKLAQSLTKPIQEINTASIRHGRKYESVALQQFKTVTGLPTSPCGLVVSKACPYLAASPDALVGEDAVVEIKCPFTAKDSVITEHTVPYLEATDGKLALLKSSPYFYQIQGQLYCTERKKCYFTVFTLQGLKYITVERDDEFVEQMVSKLTLFYHDYFKAELLENLFFKRYSKYNW